MTIYTEAKNLNIPMDNHESDLYLKVTKESIELVNKYNCSFSRFISQIDNTAWFDIPFKFDPFWDKVEKRNATSNK